jgi:hypothetical protein
MGSGSSQALAKQVGAHATGLLGPLCDPSYRYICGAGHMTLCCILLVSSMNAIWDKEQVIQLTGIKNMQFNVVPDEGSENRMVQFNNIPVNDSGNREVQFNNVPVANSGNGEVQFNNMPVV